MALFGSRLRLKYIGYPLKRTIDIAFGVASLVFLSPLFLLIGCAVRLSSPGPILFKQQRLGLGERPFQILKFRTMRVDAQQTGPAYTTAGDPRVTAVGRLLRKTSLDEIPQAWNVLRGDMSIFGPRPYVGFELEHWSAEQRATRARVRPGISGLSQTSGRSELEGDKRIECDLTYVRECSAMLDCVLAFRTLIAVLKHEGTN